MYNCLFSVFLILVSLPAVAQTAQQSTGGGTQNILVEKPNSAIQNFGKVAFEVIGNGDHNAIVGGVRQTGTAGHTFPTGVTGYASMEDAGNQAFGLFGRCDLGAPSMHISGTCTNELNSFNFAGTPSTLLPPDLSFAAVQRNAISLQLVAYGDFDSSIALNLAGGGGAKQFYVGEYLHPRSSIFAGIIVDANMESSARYGAILKATSKNSPLRLESVGTPEPLNSVIEYVDGNGATEFKINQAGDAKFSGTISARTIDLAAGGYLRLANSIVSELPICNEKFRGVLMAVTDAMHPRYNGAVKGGGKSNIPVFCNGSEWTAH